MNETEQFKPGYLTLASLYKEIDSFIPPNTYQALKQTDLYRHILKVIYHADEHMQVPHNVGPLKAYAFFPMEVIDAAFESAGETLKEKSRLTYISNFFTNDPKNRKIHNVLAEAFDDDPRRLIRQMERQAKIFLEIASDVDQARRTERGGRARSAQFNTQIMLETLKRCKTFFGSAAADISVNAENAHRVLARILLLTALLGKRTKQEPDGHMDLDDCERVWTLMSTPEEDSASDNVQGILSALAVENDYTAYLDAVKRLYVERRYDEAIKALRQIWRSCTWATDRACESDLWLGKCYLKRGTIPDIDAAWKAFRTCTHKRYRSEALYLMATSPAFDRLAENTASVRKEALFTVAASARENSFGVDAAILLAEAFARGSSRYEIEANISRAAEYAESVLHCSDLRESPIARANFVLGQYYDSIRGGRRESQRHYARAAELGYEPARKKLHAMRRMELSVCMDGSSFRPNVSAVNHCYVNSMDGLSPMLLAHRPQPEWSLYISAAAGCAYPEAVGTPAALLDRLLSGSMTLSTMHHIIVSFLSNDESRNVTEALAFTDSVYNRLLDLTEGGRQEDAAVLSEILEVYVKARYDTASMLLDASVADMGNFYIKTRIFDEDRDSAHHLLFRAPLIIPCIQDPRPESHPKVVAVGNSSFIYEFVKEAIACTYMDVKHRAPEIMAIGHESRRLEAKLRQNCPGLYADNGVPKIRPRFYNVDLDHPALPSIIAGIPSAVPTSTGEPAALDDPRKVAEALAGANYFVVDVGDDMENIAFARKLRGWLLKSDPRFERIPFIGLRCKDATTAYLAERLTVGTRAPDQSWFNTYNLYCFSPADLYFGDNPIETLALNMHLFYSQKNPAEGYKRYYTHSYNRDSSTCSAIGLIYRMMDMDVHFKNGRDYFHADIAAMRSELARPFDRLLDDAAVRELSRVEQLRWNCFMFTRGWEGATCDQVETYMNTRMCNTHKQELARLHPHIVDWEDLSDTEGSSFFTLRERLGADKVSNPLESTENSVRNTAAFFPADESIREITHIEER